MIDDAPTALTVQATVKAPPEHVWKLWTTPADIKQWNNPSEDWLNETVEVDLRNGGAFLFRMKARDGSQGFDYCGNYDTVVTNKLIILTTAEGRKAINTFRQDGEETIITETFELEKKTPVNVQKDFCQGVLNSFKKYAESKLQ